MSNGEAIATLPPKSFFRESVGLKKRHFPEKVWGLAGCTLPDTCCFTATAAQVEESGSAYATTGDNFDLLDSWIMQSKGLLDTDTVGNFSYGVGGVHGAAFTSDYHALEDLDTLFASFDDADMYLDGITGTELRVIHTHLLSFDFIDDCTHNVSVG